MEMDKWAEMKKKVDEMPEDDFLLLSDLVKGRTREIEKAKIEHTLDEINLKLQGLNQDFKLEDEDGQELSYPYVKFYYDKDTRTIMLGIY